MNLASLDLNLLVALDALLREASVSRAAERIGLSQPATSHALRRLRDLMGDPLLVRAGPRMELTPRAEALREPLAAALAQVQGLFAEEAFDPAVSRRRFKAMIPDVSTWFSPARVTLAIARSLVHVPPKSAATNT